MIRIVTDEPRFFSDLGDVLRLFYGDVTVSLEAGDVVFEHHFAEADGLWTDTWASQGKRVSLSRPISDETLLVVKRLRKRQVKQALYELLNRAEIYEGGGRMTNEQLTGKVVELDERTIRHTEQIKSAFNRIDELHALTSSVHRMATALEVLASAQKSTEKKVDTLTRDLEEIKGKPGKRWEDTARLVFELALAAAVGLVLVKLGLK